MYIGCLRECAFSKSYNTEVIAFAIYTFSKNAPAKLICSKSPFYIAVVGQLFKTALFHSLPLPLLLEHAQHLPLSQNLHSTNKLSVVVVVIVWIATGGGFLCSAFRFSTTHNNNETMRLSAIISCSLTGFPIVFGILYCKQ